MGTRSNRLGEAVLTSTHNLCFEQKYEKYLSFLSENFLYLQVQFSIYLNRHVFVMGTSITVYDFCFWCCLFLCGLMVGNCVACSCFVLFVDL